MVWLWIGICVAGAMLCAVIRAQRPELATGVSLAIGAAVMAMLASQAEAFLPQAGRLSALLTDGDRAALTPVLRAAGITLAAELAGQLCRDAGESALAGRVALVARASILMLCMPIIADLLELLSSPAL